MMSSLGIMKGITFAKSQLLAMEVEENAFEALKKNTEDPEIYFALGKSYYRLNKNKKVREILDILNMLDRSLYDQIYSRVGGQ